MKLWPWWILVVVTVSGPWYGATREPQWRRVTWVPFHGAEDKPTDMAANFALWVPFGLSFGRDGGRSRLASAMLATLGLSTVVEASQLFCLLRDPSATDVVMGVLGSAAGSVAAQAFHGWDARRTPRRGKAGDARGHE